MKVVVTKNGNQLHFVLISVLCEIQNHQALQKSDAKQKHFFSKIPVSEIVSS